MEKIHQTPTSAEDNSSWLPQPLQLVGGRLRSIKCCGTREPTYVKCTFEDGLSQERDFYTFREIRYYKSSKPRPEPWFANTNPTILPQTPPTTPPTTPPKTPPEAVEIYSHLCAVHPWTTEKALQARFQPYKELMESHGIELDLKAGTPGRYRLGEYTMPALSRDVAAQPSAALQDGRTGEDTIAPPLDGEEFREMQNIREMLTAKLG